MKMRRRLDVCIAAWRRKGLENIATLPHPAMEGVRYIVAWQPGVDDPADIPEELCVREDFLIIPNDTRGTGANRQVALAAAEAPVVLMSDDDVSHTPDQLKNLLRAFEERPDCDFLIVRYHSDSHPRPYPEYEFDMRNEPKGFFFGGPEIAVRLKPVRDAGVDFNPLFGVGSEFCAGEDNIFVYEMMQKGLKGHFVPVTVCGHESDSTGMRGGHKPEYLRAKGAAFTYIHPRSWLPRMILHALRETHSPGEAISYCRAWLRGPLDLRRLRRKRTKKRT